MRSVSLVGVDFNRSQLIWLSSLDVEQDLGSNADPDAATTFVEIVS